MQGSRLERGERICFRVAVACAALGFLTSAGCSPLPSLTAGAVPWLHPLLLLAGAAAGLASSHRGVEIDRRRWELLEEPLLTDGERQLAHKEAERQRRWASLAYLGAPLMLGYWLAYQVEGEGRALAAALLPVTAVLGSVAGLAWARLRERPPD